MELEICTVSGFDEVGRNMVAIRCGDEAVIIDMGILLSVISELQQQGQDYRLFSTDSLIEMGAIPDDSVIDGWNVKAIVIGHCHLDHVAGVPFLAAKYGCPIYGSPFTLQVLKSLLHEQRIKLPNEIKPLALNRIVPLSRNFKLELMNTPHSTLQCAITVLHTAAGNVVYSNDFKLDSSPTLNQPTNYERIEQLRKEGVRALICDSLYAPSEEHTESESVVRDKLRNVLIGEPHDGQAVFVTCFSSHLERIKSILDLATEMERKVIVLGRSMVRYITCAHEAGAIDFFDRLEVCSFSKQVHGAFRKIAEDPGKYLVICTGGQGEPNSVLDRILRGELPYQFREKDCLVFSNKTIPVEPNTENRAKMEKRLDLAGVQYYLDVHVSGHAAAKDLRNFIKLLDPDHVIPSHGFVHMTQAMDTLCEELGYRSHLMHNGEKLLVDD